MNREEIEIVAQQVLASAQLQSRKKDIPGTVITYNEVTRIAQVHLDGDDSEIDIEAQSAVGILRIKERVMVSLDPPASIFVTGRLALHEEPLEQWHEVGETGEPTFGTGWANDTSSNYAKAGFWKDPDGLVHLKGRVKTSSGASTTIFALPSAYWPWFSGTAFNANPIRALTLKNGTRINVEIYGASSTNVGEVVVQGSVSTNDWITLDGIIFPTNDTTALFHRSPQMSFTDQPNPTNRIFSLDRFQDNLSFSGYIQTDLWPRAILDRWGVVHLTGGFLASGTPSSKQFIASFSPEYAVQSQQIFSGPTDTSTGSFSYDVTGARLNYRSGTVTTEGWLTSFHSPAVASVGDAWLMPGAPDGSGGIFGPGDFPFENGGPHDDSKYFAYPKIWKDERNIVWFVGMVEDMLDGETMFTLPEGYRPSERLVFPVSADSIPAQVDVDTDGSVIKVDGGTDFLSLAMVHFRAAD